MRSGVYRFLSTLRRFSFFFFFFHVYNFATGFLWFRAGFAEFLVVELWQFRNGMGQAEKLHGVIFFPLYSLLSSLIPQRTRLESLDIFNVFCPLFT